MYKLALYLTSAFFIFILWVIYMADTGQSSVFFDFVNAIPQGDKMGHVGLFGLLTLGANLGLRFKRIKVGRVNIFSGTVLVSIFALLEEFSQYFAPTRTLDFLDLCADAIGITLFTVISYYLGKKHLILKANGSLLRQMD